MNGEKYLVSKRPSLESITNFPRVDYDEYDRKMKPFQSKLQLIQQAYLGTREHAVIVLEGRDAAGKGGVVRRLGWTLDPRSLKVHPIAAPTPNQKISALSPTLLVQAARARSDRCLRQVLVRPRAGRAH